MIYFCIPALNEERTVGVVLWKLRQVMTDMQRDFQIVVVDDASTDATQEVLNPYIRVLPLTLIRNDRQLGYAASMEIAIREAVRRAPYPKRDALITLQADFTEDPDVVPALIKRIEAGADLVTVEPAFDDATPANVRRARRFFRWLVRGAEWALAGDPFATPRAYRVITVKRALEARGTGRLLTWEGVAANAELLAQTLPHSRRTDTVETTVHYKRLQRASRFRFFPILSQVMGMRKGKPGHAAPVPLPESTIVVPAALAVELATSQRRDERRRRPGGTRDRKREQGREPRRNGDARRRDEGRRREGSRRARPAASDGAKPAAPLAEPSTPPAPQPEKKRRRSRKRGRKPQNPAQPGTTAGEAPELTLHVAEGDTVPGEVQSGNGAAEETGARKKSRRGRRGGRGRKRGARPGNGEANQNTEANADSAPAEAPQPPMEG